MVHYDRPETGHVLTVTPELRVSDFHYFEAAITYRDRVWVICTEGVGVEVTDDKPLDAGAAGIFSRTDVLAIIASADRETRPLETWIRNHNDRLQGNFHMWSRALDIARDDLHESECGELHATAALKDSHERTCEWCQYDEADAAATTEWLGTEPILA